jgi:hypothetical protein
MFQSLKRLFGSLLTPRKTTGKHRRSGRVRPRLEALEDRLAPATISDGGTAALSIVLGANENLAIVSNGTNYAFTSNQTLTAASAADPANQASAFSGFGTMNLTLRSAGLAQYRAGINITDAGANATVTFNDSGAHSYANNFTIALSNAAAGPINFNGKSDFGAFNLQASTTLNILLNSGAALTSSAGNLTLQSNQQTTPTSGDFAGVTVDNATIESTDTGKITVEGTGGTLGHGEYGVFVENSGTITGGTGPVLVGGVGGATPFGSAFGVLVTGNNSRITSNGGNVQVTGTGGGSGNGSNIGVYVQTGGEVSADRVGQNVSGTLTIHGTGGATSGDGNVGVAVDAGTFGTRTTITTGGGSVLVTGQGGGSGASTANYGVWVRSVAALIAAGGFGTLTVLGIGGASTGKTYGVLDGGLVVGGGGVNVTGQGGAGLGAQNDGVFVDTLGTIADAGPGTITVLGTANPGGVSEGVVVNSLGEIVSSGRDIQITGVAGVSSAAAIDLAGSITTLAVGSPVSTIGNISLTGDSMHLQGGNVDAGKGAVTLLPKTAGTLINLGGDNTPGTLGLTNAELNLIIAATLNIGEATSGTITVSAPIALPGPTNVNLTSGGDIIFNPGSITTYANFPGQHAGSGNLTLAPGRGGAVRPITSGTDANVAPGNLAFAPGSNLAIAINGTTVDDQYNQLNVYGSIDLTGANLLLSGTLHPALGQTFTIVKAGPKFGNPPPFFNGGIRLGEFNGLPEGARISNLLGSPLDAVITYNGGVGPDGGPGDDVVLTVVPHAPPQPKPTINSLNSLEGTSGLTPFVFQIRLTSPARSPMTYDVYTTDGAAKAGVNYIGITAGDSAHGGTVTFAPGSAFATVTVYVIAGSLPVTPATVRADFTVNLADPLAPGVSLASGTGIITAQVAAPRAAVPAAAHRRLRSEPGSWAVAIVVGKKLDDEWDN